MNVDPSQLTNLEYQVWKLTSKPLPNKEIASTLGLTVSAVQNAHQRLYAKLGIPEGDGKARRYAAIKLFDQFEKNHAARAPLEEERQSDSTVRGMSATPASELPKEVAEPMDQISVALLSLLEGSLSPDNQEMTLKKVRNQITAHKERVTEQARLLATLASLDARVELFGLVTHLDQELEALRNDLHAAGTLGLQELVSRVRKAQTRLEADRLAEANAKQFANFLTEIEPSIKGIEDVIQTVQTSKERVEANERSICQLTAELAVLSSELSHQQGVDFEMTVRAKAYELALEILDKIARMRLPSRSSNASDKS